MTIVRSKFAESDAEGAARTLSLAPDAQGYNTLVLGWPEKRFDSGVKSTQSSSPSHLPQLAMNSPYVKEKKMLISPYHKEKCRDPVPRNCSGGLERCAGGLPRRPAPRGHSAPRSRRGAHAWKGDRRPGCAAGG